jgi:crotonobetainyl-CoA:carnitine CoA-transferase CaiB-like acyl-CoA transferase
MDDSRVRRWAASGAMALTGTPEQPLGPPEGLVDGIEELARPFPDLDGLALLGERAVHMGLWRRGTTSCGGSCRLLRSSETFAAVSLARDDDFEVVPAWLELDGVPPTAPAAWSAVAHALARCDTDELVARAALLGLPVARVGEASGGRPGVVRVPLGAAPARELTDLIVVDLSALWAGPLCGDLLAAAGASVIKVESTSRPDGARRGPAAFFDLLNGRKRSVALDFHSDAGVATLRALVARADVVLEASRPRALEQLGISAHDEVAGGGPQVWISITGYGRTGDGRERVAFGDDAAAGGGLVVWHAGTPMFCADAVADPITGLAAARACLDALAAGGRWLLDVSMAGLSAALAGPTLPVSEAVPVEPPRARPVARVSPELGADTAEVLDELDLRM